MTLQKKIARSVEKNLSFYLTGSILTAITIMLLVGAFAVSHSIYECFTPYFDETRVEDASFVTMTEIPEEEREALEKAYDVTLERQQYTDLDYDGTRLRLFAATEKLDLYTVSEGRKIEAADDIVVTYRYAKANHIAVGDTLHLAGRDFQVCGLGMKPDYAIMLYDLSESAADKEGFGIGIIGKDAMESLGGTVFYSVRYKDQSLEKDFRKTVYEKYQTIEYLERSANSRISLMYREADDLSAEFSLYCPIIMIVVIAVIATVLARTVRREGKTIGTLMALGYRKSELIRHYMAYGMIPAVAGDILGVLFCIPFSRMFCGFFFGDAEYIAYEVKIPWGLLAVALLLPLVVYGLVSYLVLCGVLKVEIIPLLKGIHQEKTSRILNGSQAKLGVIYNIRTVCVNRFRSITLVIGIAVATLCIVLGGAFQDAYADLLENKVPYAMLGGQYEYGFNTYQSDGNPYGGDAVFDVSFGAKADDSRFNLIGFDDENQFADLCSEDGEPLSGKKYYMTSAAAARYGIAAGDTFCFYNTVTLEETEVVIDGIVKNDILSLVLTGKENAAAILERPADEYNVIISREKLAIPGELLKKSSSLQDYRDMVEHLSSTAGIVLKLLKVLGVCICILIVVMICGMITEESSRNISMLEILGYRDREVRSFVLSSGHLLVPVGFVIGVPLGYLTAYSMVLASAQSSGMRMSLPVRAETILAAFVFVLVAYILALALSGRKIHRVDMAESLKNVEE